MEKPQKRKWTTGVALALLGAMAAGSAVAVDVTSEELAQARRWIAAKFAETAEAKQSEPGLIVLANHDAVVKNTRGEGRPLTIAKKEYRRGLYCHAGSHVVVCLPGRRWS